MKALFDKDLELRAWLRRDGEIFDQNLAWIAFVEGDHGFSAGTLSWLGPADGTTLRDQQGRPCLWAGDAEIGLQMRYQRPLRPAKREPPASPLGPLRARRPVMVPQPPLGWSELSFKAWLGQW